MRGDEFFIQVAKRPPFSQLHPQVGAFFKTYLAHEKVIQFDGHWVVNTHFPPYPSPAFDRLADGFLQFGQARQRRLYSVTLAVTNRCSYRCWHCYNAGRSEADVPLNTLRGIAHDLGELGAVMVTLTGGEPLLRSDLEEIATAFDARFCLNVGTTGAGLTATRARRLRKAGVFGVGISLDAADEAQHDQLRGRQGAFRTALEALQIAQAAGLYPYVVAVATREFLQHERFMAFMRFAGDAGAREVHVLEPSATGRLAGRSDVLLSASERQLILDYQRQVAGDDSLPVLSSYAYLESSDAFGCGAGLTHLYIDGSGEVCPCQLVPLSFGNVVREPLTRLLARMGKHFCQPRAACVGRVLNRHVPDGQWPTPPRTSCKLCQEHLPRRHTLPRFFKAHAEARRAVGRSELRAVYDRVHDDYDAYWLTAAAHPIDELVRKLPWHGTEGVFEAGCGTGYATALLAARAARVVAADLSQGMLSQARQRLRAAGCANVEFRAGDALALLKRTPACDVVFSSWVLGYIPLRPFFSAAAGALSRDGRVAFVVHKLNSPREPLEIFAELVARDPRVLRKQVAFDFPRDAAHLTDELTHAGLAPTDLWEGTAVFRYARPQDVLAHLLKSGAGTAFYDALDPAHRARLADEFLALLAARHPAARDYEVTHEYLACIAQRGPAVQA